MDQLRWSGSGVGGYRSRLHHPYCEGTTRPYHSNVIVKLLSCDTVAHQHLLSLGRHVAFSKVCGNLHLYFSPQSVSLKPYRRTYTDTRLVLPDTLTNRTRAIEISDRFQTNVAPADHTSFNLNQSMADEQTLLFPQLSARKWEQRNRTC